MESYEVLTGVGYLFVAPSGEAFPDLDDADVSAVGNWKALGETVDGITITYGEDIEEITVDQETGPVKAIRTGETLTIETNLAKQTLENLAQVLSQTVATTAPGSGTVGYKSIGGYKGGAVTELALVFRGSSPYGANYIGQLEIPVGYFGGEVGLEFTKDGVAAIPCVFHALVDPNAASTAVKFGRIKYQNAAALP